MESGGTNLSDIYREEALLGDSAFSRYYNRHYNRRCNTSKFLFHFLEAIAEVLSIRTCRKGLNLAVIFMLEGGVSDAYVSLVNRMDGP